MRFQWIPALVVSLALQLVSGPASAVTGSFTYNAGSGTVDFTLTLAVPASFGPVSLLAGSTFSATGVPVITAPLGGGAFVLSQIAPTSGVAGPVLSPAFPTLAATPAVSGLMCTVGTGADQCGMSLGGGGLTFDASPFGILDAFLTFNVNVPEPGTALPVLGGLTGLVFAGRRRASPRGRRARASSGRRGDPTAALVCSARLTGPRRSPCS